MSASRVLLGNKENIAPNKPKTFTEEKIPRPMMRKLNSNSSIAVAQRASEAFFHLKALIKERRNMEDQLSTKFPGSETLVPGSRGASKVLTGPRPRETLDTLMAATKEEEIRLGVLVKAIDGKVKKTSTESFNQTFQVIE